MSRFARLFAGLLLAGLGAGGYLSYRHSCTQAQFGQALQQLTATLAMQNDEAAVVAGRTLQMMEEAVAKNRNQPAELAVLHRAQALGQRLQTLCDSLRGLRQRLGRTVGNATPTGPFSYSGEAAPVAQLLGHGTPAQRALHQQLAACADTLRRLGAAAAPLTLPVFDQLPATEALAALTLLEAQVRASEARTIRHLARPLGAPDIPVHFVAAATAERATVAPGDTYRARLSVVKNLAPASLRMYCTGRPVPVGPDGVGFVRFRAPLRPGPASWVGMVRINQNGRDTTFVVRVPYRVAHH